MIRRLLPAAQEQTNHRADPQRRLRAILGGFLVGAGLVTGMIVAAPNAAATSIGSTLSVNQWLNTGDSLENGAYTLLMQGDGNLVLYASGQAVWASDTAGHPGAHMILQGDGDLVIYDNTQPVWNTMTSGSPEQAVMQGDGNFVLYENGTAPWASGTINGQNELLASSVFRTAWTELNSYPYSWAGGHGLTPGPTLGQCDQSGCSGLHTVGFDCSGFTRWIYAMAAGGDILGSGDTNNQVAEMHQTSSPAPGDLIFFGASTTNSDHVGIFIGNNKMIDAFETGTRVQINNISDTGGFLGFWHY